MFGQTAAGYAFLRFSRAIAALAARLLNVVVVEFFGDFNQIEPASSADSAWQAMAQLLTLLGWEVSMSQKKRMPFQKEFVSLGVQTDLKESANNIVVVKHKPGRIEGIRLLIDAVLKQGTLGFKEALSIKGKESFAEGQLFSRVAAPVCRLLSLWARAGDNLPLNEEMQQALSTTCTALYNSKPKRIGPGGQKPPVLIWTDGACEPSGTSIGGVMFDPGSQVEFFGAVLSDHVVQSWTTHKDQKQVIGQAELFPLLISRLTWANRLEGRRVIYFIDNDSARLACIKAYSPVLPSLVIVMDCLAWDSDNSSSSWFARAPTDSNIADDPSRMDPRLLVEVFGARAVSPVFPEEGMALDIL